MKFKTESPSTKVASREMLIQVSAWSAYPWLRHGFSTRHGGVSTIYQSEARQGRTESWAGSDLNLGWTKDDDPANVAVNRLLLVAAASGTAATPLFTLRQIHSNRILKVPDAASLWYFVDLASHATREADGLITAAPGALLGIQTADCVPVFVVDTKKRVVAAFHAGWRGTAARIVDHGIAEMVSEYGSRSEDLIAAIGPSIGACCYTVGEEVQGAFAAEFAYAGDLFKRLENEWHLDLWEANRRQLVASGLAESKISIIGECTGCTGLPLARRYFSHRCEHGFTGRMMNVIGIDSN